MNKPNCKQSQLNAFNYSHDHKHCKGKNKKQDWNITNFEKQDYLKMLQTLQIKKHDYFIDGRTRA